MDNQGYRLLPSGDCDTMQSERVLLHRAIAFSQNGITIGRASGGEFPLIYANPAFYSLSGYSPEDILGNDCRLLQRAVTDQPGLEILRAAMAKGQETTVLLRNFRKDGTQFWNELSVSPVLDDSGCLTHYVGIQHDVTQREEDARAIAALNLALTQRGEELELANTSLRSFSASASHDLRAPLAAIQGFCTALQTSMATPDSKSAHYLARIEANAQRMDQLIEALLELARSTAKKICLERCDLSAIAQQVVDLMRVSCPTYTAQVDIAPGLAANCDPVLVHSVLVNLIGNAMKYSSKNPAAQVHVGREEGGTGAARFFVRDNGAGFDMQAAGTLFGTFQRFHAEFEFPGTGVGLATVRSIVTRHGGAVSAESAPGQGAAFYFTLEAP